VQNYPVRVVEEVDNEGKLISSKCWDKEGNEIKCIRD